MELGLCSALCYLGFALGWWARGGKRYTITVTRYRKH